MVSVSDGILQRPLKLKGDSTPKIFEAGCASRILEGKQNPSMLSMSAKVSRAESDEDFAPSIERFMSDSLNMEFCDGGGGQGNSKESKYRLTRWPGKFHAIHFAPFCLLVHGLIWQQFSSAFCPWR